MRKEFLAPYNLGSPHFRGIKALHDYRYNVSNMYGVTALQRHISIPSPNSAAESRLYRHMKIKSLKSILSYKNIFDRK